MGKPKLSPMFQTSFIPVFLLVSILFSCSRKPDCPNDKMLLKDDVCKCIAPFYGDGCQYEDVCLTSEKECNGYECFESECQCPEGRTGDECDFTDFDKIDATGRYEVIDWVGEKYYNFELDSIFINEIPNTVRAWEAKYTIESGKTFTGSSLITTVAGTGEYPDYTYLKNVLRLVNFSGSTYDHFLGIDMFGIDTEIKENSNGKFFYIKLIGEIKEVKGSNSRGGGSQSTLRMTEIEFTLRKKI